MAENILKPVRVSAADKLTVKQERFCEAFIETGNASEAYRRTYSTSNMAEKTVWEKASHMLAKDKVKARVENLKAMHRERHEITVDRLTQMLEEDRELARKEGQAGAAVSATMSIAKLHGMILDKKELTGKNGEPLNPVREFTELESARRIAFILGKAVRRQKEDSGDEGSAKADVLRFNPDAGKIEAA
jgi:hypothetical protein